MKIIGSKKELIEVLDNHLVYATDYDGTIIDSMPMWNKFGCMRPHPEPYMENQIISGAGEDLLSSMCDCFINHHVEDKEFFMNRMSIQKKD